MLNNPVLLTEVYPPVIANFRIKNHLGATWWRNIRKTREADNNDNCWCCGKDRSQIKMRSWFKGLELYNVDPINAVATFTDVVTICPYCHAFRNSRKTLNTMNRGSLSRGRVAEIFEHGFSILDKNGLRPHIEAMISYLSFMGYSNLSIITILKEKGVDLPFKSYPNSWKIIFDGEVIEEIASYEYKLCYK